MQKASLVIIFFIINSVFSQNLVLNPSFEKFNRCPGLIGTFSYNVQDWSIPNMGTTDFFSNCSKTVGNINYNGSQTPNDGNAYAGFYLYAPDNYREYIQGKLSETLKQGQIYNMDFYISLAENSTDAINQIGILFTEEPFGFQKTSADENANLNKKTQKELDQINDKYINPERYTKNQYKMIEIQDSAFFKNTQDWTKISFVFTATGFENFFSIGNFQSNAKTKTLEQLYSKKNNFAYYYIDNVSIGYGEKTSPIEIIIEDSSLERPFENNRNYVFKNVLFDFDKSVLLEVSKVELDKLSDYLNKNPKIKVEIYGHTDSIGTVEINEKLSHDRAKAVSDYLIEQGLNPEYIKWFGYGSSQPLISNDTDKGRAINRRVEFKLILD